MQEKIINYHISMEMKICKKLKSRIQWLYKNSETALSMGNNMKNGQVFSPYTTTDMQNFFQLLPFEPKWRKKKQDSNAVNYWMSRFECFDFYMVCMRVGGFCTIEITTFEIEHTHKSFYDVQNKNHHRKKMCSCVVALA